jgi:UDPglucose 6-dehydrogenase
MVRLGMGSDERIGNRFLFPGIGYGGSCFPKDVKALVHSADKAGYDFKILKAVEEVNAIQKKSLLPKIQRHFGNLHGKHFAVWGLAFKPNTDDIREAPALELIAELLQAGATVAAYDPEAMNNVQKHSGLNIRYTDNQYDALQGAYALIIATEWPEFRTPDFSRIRASLQHQLIFDGRNVFDLDAMRREGFTYYSIGRSDLKA